MKKSFNSLAALTFSALTLTMGYACRDSSGDDEAPTETKDSSILDNYNNNYPNDRIHMQDSSASADSARAAKGDTTKK